MTRTYYLEIEYHSPRGNGSTAFCINATNMEEAMIIATAFTMGYKFAGGTVDLTSISNSKKRGVEYRWLEELK